MCQTCDPSELFKEERKFKEEKEKWRKSKQKTRKDDNGSSVNIIGPGY